MTVTIDTVLLLALPASGKSEVRRYLNHLSPERRREDLHIGSMVQLDDFVYVHLMRRMDEELERLGCDRVFFHSSDRPFKDTRHFGTLIHLLNDDYDDLVSRRVVPPQPAAARLLERLEGAALKVGVRDLFRSVGPARGTLQQTIEAEAAALFRQQQAHDARASDDRTILIEFARGGPDGASMPLPAPLGYHYSLSQLAPGILERAVILYVWVTPEESRRKNEQRSDPDDPGSILHHGVPIEVMMREYGCDDLDWLESHASIAGTVAVEAHGRRYDIPVARFDNRTDKTTFARRDVAQWKVEDRRALHDGLGAAFDSLFRLHTALRRRGAA